MSDELRSPEPDPKGMADRLDSAIWRHLNGAELTENELRVVQMYFSGGGCGSCG